MSISHANTKLIKLVIVIGILLTSSSCANGTALPKPSTQVSDQVISAPCKGTDGVGLPSQDLGTSHILYQAYDKSTGQEQVWAISITDGSRKLILNGGSYLGLGFLKDGYHFVLSSGDGEALLSDLDGSPPRPISSNDEILGNFIPYSFMWSSLTNPQKFPDAKDYAIGRLHSPDNQKIAVWQEGDKSLLIIDRATNTEISVVQTNEYEEIRGNWSPDGKQFAFIFEKTREDYYSQLFLVEADGTNLHPLTGRLEKTTSMWPLWSPDGKKIAFHVLDQSAWPHETIRVLNLDTGELQTFSTGAPTQPSLMVQNDFVWSPDSNWLLYLISWGQIDIRAINVESGEIYCMTNDPLVEQIMDWK